MTTIPRSLRSAISLRVALGVVSTSITFGASGCEKPAHMPPAAVPGHQLASLTVTSPSFRSGARIPIDNTCDGADKMPPLVWSAPPEGTKSIAIFVEDLDAATTFTHALIYGLPSSTSKLPEGPDLGETGARFGANDFGNVRWNGPCPAQGEAHRYRFVVLALDNEIDAREGLTHAELDSLMNKHILAMGVLPGFFAH